MMILRICVCVSGDGDGEEGEEREGEGEFVSAGVRGDIREGRVGV